MTITTFRGVHDGCGDEQGWKGGEKIEGATAQVQDLGGEGMEGVEIDTPTASPC